MPTHYMRDKVSRNQMLMPWVPSETISTGDAAAMMQCCKDTIRELLEDGTIKGYRIRPNTKCSPWRVYRKSVERYIESLKRDNALEDSADTSDARDRRSAVHSARR